MIHDVIGAFKTVYDDAARGTRAADMHMLTALPNDDTTSFIDVYTSLGDSQLGRATYDIFMQLMNHTARPASTFASFYSAPGDPRPRLSPLFRLVPKLKLWKVTFGTRTGNIRNSFICFKDPLADTPAVVRAGQINTIFLHAHVYPDHNERVVEPFFIIDEYVPLAEDHAARDPYRRFPLLNTQLFYDRFGERSTIIRPVDIVAHFAAMTYVPKDIGERCIVVRSLDRVCTLYITQQRGLAFTPYFLPQS